MKTVSKYVFCTALSFLAFSGCTKKFEGDLSRFSLNGTWKFSSADTTLRWSNITIPTAKDHFSGEESTRKLVFRKRFILPGHFTEETIYLSVGTVQGQLDIRLNGHYLESENSFLLSRNAKHSQLIAEISPSLLHFGRENQVEIHPADTTQTREFITTDKGLFSRMAFLKANGLAVTDCHFSAERDIHARLEDFGTDWLNRDSTALRSFFYGSLLQSDSMLSTYIQKLIGYLDIYQPARIELSHPGFYCYPADSSVLVLGDWVFSGNQHIVRTVPFYLKFTEKDHIWVIMDKWVIGRNPMPDIINKY